jgi:hypothetical protein
VKLQVCPMCATVKYVDNGPCMVCKSQKDPMVIEVLTPEDVKKKPISTPLDIEIANYRALLREWMHNIGEPTVAAELYNRTRAAIGE